MGLPLCNGNNAIFTSVDRLTKYCRLRPYLVEKGALSAFLVAKPFYENMVRFFGGPEEVILYRDPRLTASF